MQSQLIFINEQTFMIVKKNRYFIIQRVIFYQNVSSIIDFLLYFQINFQEFSILIQYMKQKIIILLVLQIYAQLFSSSLTTISSESYIYITQIYYFSSSVLITTITTIYTENNFSFAYIANLSNINSSNSNCNLNIYSQSNANATYLISIRSILIKNNLPIWITLYNSSNLSPLLFSTNFSNPNSIKIESFLLGWLNITDYFLNYSLNWTNNTLKIYSNISNANWMQFAILMYESTMFTLHESTYSQSIDKSANFAIYGFKSIYMLPNIISINCTLNYCISSITNSKYLILTSNYTDIIQSSSSNTISVNWLQIGIIVFSSTVFLIALLITLKVLKNRFCSNEIIDQNNNGEQTNNNLIANQVMFQEIERESSKKAIFCCICLDQQANCMILPCQHTQYCKTCIKYILESKKECSICRGKINKVRYFTKQIK